jgi:polygalacturonase
MSEGNNMKNGLLNIAAGMIVSFCFLLVSTEPEQSSVRSFVDEMRLYSTALAQASGKILNVKELGARGDGVTNDTAAIQAAINAATKGATIYFPVGTYILSDLKVNRSGLSFVGEGRESIIKQSAGANRIATFEGSSDITITKVAFDANGIVSYGGVVFYAARRVRIESTRFTDSAPKPPGSNDRYAFVFARGASPSQDVQIRNNIIDGLQLEVDHAKGVVIEGNTVSGAVRTAGIGIFTIGDNAVAEDYLITGNTVIDPTDGAGFSAGLDPPKSRNCIFRRITITNNRIIRKKTAGYGIRVGTSDNSTRTVGNLFEDLTIKDNQFLIAPTAPAPSQMIFANTSSAAGIVFERLIVTGNTIENERPNREYAIDLRQVRNSIVTDNSVKGVASGISLTGNLLANQVRNNVVEASEVAYRLEDSMGGNRAANNRIVGKPRQGWILSNMKPTDTVQQ